MLNVKASIISVNYSQSLYNMLPVFWEKCKSMEPGSGIIRFFQELNSSSMDKMLKTLSCLPDGLYNQLLCIIATLYNEVIKDRLDYMVQSQEFGESIKTGGFYIGQEHGGNLSLYVNNIEADYNSLTRYAKEKGLADRIIQNISGGKLPRTITSVILNTIISILSGMESQKLEDQLLFLLKQRLVRNKLADSIEKSLLNNGIVIKFGDIEFSKSGYTIPGSEELERMEELLLDMLALWAEKHQ